MAATPAVQFPSYTLVQICVHMRTVAARYFSFSLSRSVPARVWVLKKDGNKQGTSRKTELCFFFSPVKRRFLVVRPPVCSENKDTLLQLPSAPSLRRALCGKLDTAALGEDFARTRTIPEVQRMALLSLSSLPTKFKGRLERTLIGHEGSVNSVAVCGRGKRVVSGSSDCSVKVWRLGSGRLLRTMTGHESCIFGWGVMGVAVSVDGSRAASGGADMTVRVWNLNTGKQEHVFSLFPDLVHAVAFAVDGQSLIAGRENGYLMIWKLGSGSGSSDFDGEQTLHGHDNAVNGVAVSPDGDTVVSASADRTVGVWSLRSRSRLRVLRGHSQAVLSVAVSPDGRTVVSASQDKTVRVWCVATGDAHCVFTGHTEAVESVAFFPEGIRVASASLDKSVKIWNVATQARECSLTGHTSWVKSVAVSPDGQRVVSGSLDESIKIWKSYERKEKSGDCRWRALAIISCSVFSLKLLAFWSRKSSRAQA